MFLLVVITLDNIIDVPDQCFYPFIPHHPDTCVCEEPYHCKSAWNSRSNTQHSTSRLLASSPAHTPLSHPDLLFSPSLLSPSPPTPYLSLSLSYQSMQFFIFVFSYFSFGCIVSAIALVWNEVLFLLHPMSWSQRSMDRIVSLPCRPYFTYLKL